MSDPIRADLVIYPGADLEYSWRWKAGATAATSTPVSLANYSVVSKIRDALGGNLLLDLSPYVTLQAGGDTGRIDLAVPGTITATMASDGVWDLLLVRTVAPADRTLLLSGFVSRHPTVSG